MGLRCDNQGVAQTFAFLIAGTVFVASMGAILYATNTLETGNTDPERAHLQGQARSILDTLTGSPGVGMDDPEAFERFGLLGEDGSGLDHGFMQHLCGPTEEDDPSDGRIDYGSVTRSLGLDPDDGTQFHLRIQPAELPYTNLPDFRSAYIGQINPVEDLEPPALAVEDNTYSVYVDRLNSHFTATAVSEMQTMQELGTNYTHMPHVYGSSMEGTVTTTEEIAGIEVEVTVAASEFYGAEALQGDVYFDDATYLEETLVNRVDLYDVIVVGTHVAHGELSPLDDVVSDWVLAGGILLILGTADSAANESEGPAWLGPLMENGTAVADSGVYRPESSHPLFRSFHRLDPDQFEGSQPFSNGHGGIMEDVLSTNDRSHIMANRCGALDDGLLVRLSFTESDEITYAEYVGGTGCGGDHWTTVPAGNYNPCLEDGAVKATSARALLQNLIAYGDHQGLNIDFGPPIPTTESVAHQMRILSYDHPEHGAMSVQAHVYTWDG